MHRRPLGNGRRLAFIGAIVLLVGCLLPWYTVGGDGGLTPVVYRAFDGSGIASFVAALATLALVALPYAAGERPMAVDRGLSFLLLALLALVGVILWVPGLLEAPEGFLPDRAYGYWIAVVGTIMMLRAAYDIMLEPPRR
jgi:drug/metabolite transporter (DMT)-like permease